MKKHFSRFFSDSEAFASESLKNLEVMFPRYLSVVKGLIHTGDLIEVASEVFSFHEEQ